MTEKNKSGRGIKATEPRESRLLVQHAFHLARQLGITKIMVLAEALTDQRLIAKEQTAETIIWLSLNHPMNSEPENSRYVIELPQEALSRADQFQIGLLLAVLQDLVAVDETVLCLTGLAGSLRLDNLLITNLKRDNRWFQKRAFDEVPKEILRSKEFFRILDLSLRFAEQGREGKAVGTIFVLGDQEELEPYLKQLILNPCKGHKAGLRNIHNPEFLETLRELAALDGAFIINKRGTVERAAAYIDAPLNRKKSKVPSGCGARHTAAAALTSVTNALAIVLSESSGSVIAFFGGSPILEINKQ